MDKDTLRRWRNDRNMTQTELADQLGVTQNTITRWESGRVQIQHPVILALALRWLEHEHQEGRQTAEDEQ